MKKFITMSLVLIMVAVTLVGCGGTTYEDGTHTGEADGFAGPISVEVTVTDGEISNVEVLDHSETEGISDPAIENIPAAIEEKNSTDVDAESGATGTSEGIKKAVDNALGN